MYQAVWWLIAPDIGGPASVPSEKTVIYMLVWRPISVYSSSAIIDAPRRATNALDQSPAVPRAYGHVIASTLPRKVAVIKIVVVPVEGLLCMNDWWAELRLTAGLTFATIERGEVFDRAIPMRIRFPWELHIMEMDTSERV
ncbi:hypothetical protein EI94DRAFT_1699853 [Lactarius quietus]|nr:hypothetical protein EI94DRAFT_1699853 [Lactarius quietus]